MATKYFLPALIIMFCYSCRKNNDVIQKDVQRNDQLISTGAVFNTNTGKYEPYYWINEKIYPLAFQPGISTYTSGLEVVNKTVYITGGYEPVNAEHSSLPCYWKDGRRIDLPIHDIPGFFMVCSAKDIKVIGNTIYILGAVDLNPLLWIIEGDHIKTLIIEGRPGTLYGGCRTASNLVEYNNKLYIGGDQVSRPNGVKYLFEVGYWTVDLGTRATAWHQVEKDLAHATAFAISASGKGIYISGEAQPGATGSPKIALWKNNQRVSFQVENFDKLRMNEIHMNDDGKLYANVLDYATNKPLVWKIDQHENIQAIRFNIPEGTTGYCVSAGISGDNLAFVGYYRKDLLYYIWANINGKNLELELPYRSNILMSVSEWGVIN